MLQLQSVELIQCRKTKKGHGRVKAKYKVKELRLKNYLPDENNLFLVE